MPSRPILRTLATIFLIAASAVFTSAEAQNLPQTSTTGSVVTTAHVRAELVAQAPDGVAPGQPFWVGLRIEHQPEWHTYWKNSGDSGLPTELAWTLPAGIDAGEIAWPLPRKIRIGSLVNYGYEGTLLLPVPLTVSQQYRPPRVDGLGNGGAVVEVRLQAAWLVCRKECIPEEGSFALQVPVRGSTALHHADFDAALAAQPQPLAAEGAQVRVDGQRLALRVPGLPAAAQGQRLDLFPETPEVIDNDAAQGSGWPQQWQDGVWTAEVPLSPQRTDSPQTLPLVLAVRGAGAQAAAWRVVAPVDGPW
ncbi:protein-disulfide reductase DsbD family protein, partial [Ramlibacter sp. H39-3-26]|uniref:protein-disulfide reductase DsbD domain-containing protein n=1 Tax=Curvibacter soli TaxID=3031331 RepID=UPI0023DCC95B